MGSILPARNFYFIGPSLPLFYIDLLGSWMKRSEIVANIDMILALAPSTTTYYKGIHTYKRDKSGAKLVSVYSTKRLTAY